MSYHAESYTQTNQLDLLNKLDVIQSSLISAEAKFLRVKEGYESLGCDVALHPSSSLANIAALRTSLIERMGEALNAGIDATYLRRYLNHV